MDRLIMCTSFYVKLNTMFVIMGHRKLSRLFSKDKVMYTQPFEISPSWNPRWEPLSEIGVMEKI